MNKLKMKPRLESTVKSFYPGLTLEEVADKFKVCCVRIAKNSEFGSAVYSEFASNKCSIRHENYFKNEPETTCICNKTDLCYLFCIVSENEDYLFPIGSDCINYFKNERLTVEAERMREEYRRKIGDDKTPFYYTRECSRCDKTFRQKHMKSFNDTKICFLCAESLKECSFDTCKNKTFDDLCTIHGKCKYCPSICYVRNGVGVCDSCKRTRCPCGKKKKESFTYCYHCPVYQKKCDKEKCYKFIDKRYKFCYEHKSEDKLL